MSSFATSYIPTAASQVTRTADVATITGANFSSWFNSTEGTFIASFDTAATSAGNPSVYAAQDGSINERYQLFGSGTNWRAVAADGGVAQADMAIAGFTQGATFSHAFSYKVNDFAACLNGGAVSTDTSGALPTVNVFSIGYGAGEGVKNLINGHIRSIRYYPSRLTNAQLQALTA